jgi:hypothetical protein
MDHIIIEFIKHHQASNNDYDSDDQFKLVIT